MNHYDLSQLSTAIESIIAMEANTTSAIMWKYVTPLDKGYDFKKVESLYGVKIPKDLKALIKKYNGGTPSHYDFNGKMLSKLINFNNTDDGDSNVFELHDMGNIPWRGLPFAMDAVGNFWCVYEGRIAFYDHEEDNYIVVAGNITEILHNLK